MDKKAGELKKFVLEEMKKFVLDSINTISAGRVVVASSKSKIIDLIKTDYNDMFIPHSFVSHENEPQLKQVAWELRNNTNQIHDSTIRMGITGQPQQLGIDFSLQDNTSFNDEVVILRKVQCFKRKTTALVSTIEKLTQQDKDIHVLVYIEDIPNGFEYQLIFVYAQTQTLKDIQFAYHEQAQYLRSQYALKLIEIEDGINKLSKERKNIKRALDKENYYFKDADFLCDLSQIHSVKNNGRISRMSSMPFY